MHYVVLTTGSCGNCYAFFDGENTLIIDDGVTHKKLTENLQRHDIPLSSVRALLLTHLHPDHSKGAGAFQRKIGAPVFMSETAFNAGRTVMERQKIDMASVATFSFGDSIDIPGFHITPFRTYHDSEGSAGYFFSTGRSSVFLMTDTGRIPEGAEELASSARVKFIEANYDDAMLDAGPYSEALRRRIRGVYGHLSNEEAVSFASASSHHGDSVYFIHLSANNNTPEKVRALASDRIESGIFCHVCERGETVEGYLDE